jgi:hypothetical protein
MRNYLLLIVSGFFFQLVFFFAMAQMYLRIFLRAGDRHRDTKYAQWRQTKPELQVQVTVKIHLSLKPRPETRYTHFGTLNGNNIIGNGGFDVHLSSVPFDLMIDPSVMPLIFSALNRISLTGIFIKTNYGRVV